jgi:hypothetical protein
MSNMEQYDNRNLGCFDIVDMFNLDSTIIKLHILDPPFRMDQSAQVVLRNLKIDVVYLFFVIVESVFYALLQLISY